MTTYINPLFSQPNQEPKPAQLDSSPSAKPGLFLIHSQANGSEMHENTGTSIRQMTEGHPANTHTPEYDNRYMEEQVRAVGEIGGHVLELRKHVLDTHRVGEHEAAA